MVAGGDHSRHVNGIIGLLIKEKFPGLVTRGEVTEPAYTWGHYYAAPDARDREGREFPNRAERVKRELWVSFFRTTLVLLLYELHEISWPNVWIRRVNMQDFFRCEEGHEARAADVTEKVAKKLVKDMHYEARVQAVIKYHAQHLGEKVNKQQARTIYLTMDQYLEVKCINGYYSLQ